ncbi:MAG TPA: DUF2225 domain-containing protein [Rectinemataceae bacterium]|nr:DUF2225 domain-containing protein [Rectinemataceae bacterium]
MARFAAKPERDEKERKVTFMSKEQIQCPVCDAKFHREELFSGRVNAGDLTDELHRTYIPMAHWGEVQPLVYDLSVCPSCWYTAFKADFSLIGPKQVKTLSDGIASRIESVQRLIQPLDFNSPRSLAEGAASYWLAMLCYEGLTKDFAPTFKQGLCALRGAWLFSSLDKKRPGENFDYAAALLYRKARFLYRQAIELDQGGKEPLASVKWYGPDSDKSYGFEGVIYLAGVLEYKYGPRQDAEKRAATLASSKRAIAKLFGLGKRSKNKPGPLLDKARELFDAIKADIQANDEDDEE